IMEDRQGNPWVATEKGAAKMDLRSGTFTIYTTKEGLPGNNVRFILEDRGGDLWFATNKGAARFDGTAFTVYNVRDGLCSNDTSAIMEDGNGDLWFATEGGVSRFDGNKFTSYTSKEGLSHDDVYCMLEDREKNIWFGTDLELNKLSRSAFITIGPDNGLSNSIAWSLWEAPGGTVWISTEDGIVLYNEKKKNPVSVMKKEFNGTAYPFYEDGKGTLWFGTGTGLMTYKDGDFIDVGKQTGIVDKDIYSIFEDRGGHMWFGTLFDGITKYDGQTAETFKLKGDSNVNTINTIAEDKKGRIWVGTGDGAAVYEREGFTRLTGGDWANCRSITTILPEPGEKMEYFWFGTYGQGLIRCNVSGDIVNAPTDTFTVDDGLTENEILLMVFDDAGHLWIGTNKGVCVLDVPGFKKTAKKVFRYYGIEDGFAGVECNQNAVIKNSNGNIWFGTIKGAVRYNHKEDRINPVEPVTHITGLKLFFETIDLSVYSTGRQGGAFLPISLELPYNQNHLTFDFIGINLTMPKKVRYQCQLETFDDGWSPPSKATYATYSNLPPGSYIFKVRACNNSGIWNKEAATYGFTILRPFWMHWWFILVCVVVGISGVYGYIKLRIRNLEQRRSILEEKVNRRTIELKEEKAKVEQVNLQLEERVKERTKKLVQAHKKLVQAQKMEVIGTLASGVAHDLNNVLAGIVIYPELLLMEMPEDNPYRQSVLTIQKSGEKAAAIVQDLLTLARRGVAVSEVVNLNDTISDAMKSPEMERLKLYHPWIEIEAYPDYNLSNICGSPVHLSKTIMNLVSNATEAMPERGKIWLSTKNMFLDQPLNGYTEVKKGDYAVLTVTDTGTGMTEEEMELIFEPFYTKKKMGKSGTGLGMTVVWSTMKDHSGYITVQSSKGTGTVFAIYFPVTTKKAVKGKTPFLLDDYKGNGESILVVDDMEEQRQILFQLLTQLGYSVKAVDSGEKALDHILCNPVDLVILDMIMTPGIDGLETYKRILKHRPGQKAIIISGYSESKRVKEALKLGAGLYIKKPFLMEDIAPAIKEELKRPGVPADVKER
ncbi:MAG: response regulator, partial [bacterium]|nr:response regulator [bacterium]